MSDIERITAKHIRDAVAWLRESGCGCYHFHLWTDYDHPMEREYHIVIGWSDAGYDPDDGDYYTDPDGMTICAKVAFQDRNNGMQCDFDIDWLMPYDEETGDVFDTRTALGRCPYPAEGNIHKELRYWCGVAEELNEAARNVYDYIQDQTATEYKEIA